MSADAEGAIQRQYYKERAHQYDASHVQPQDEHYFALGFMVGSLDFLHAESVLEIGSGTGRALEYLMKRAKHVRRRGIEPVSELREVAYAKGISSEELTDGDAMNLEFSDGAFDVVCEFGMLHHVRDHDRVVSEMLRVARKAVLISDSNNFGQGGPLKRALKQSLRAAGLWAMANLVKTRGKGYSLTDGDGLSYSYSVFDDYPRIRSQCRSVHVLNTVPAGIDPYRTSGHVALLGIK